MFLRCFWFQLVPSLLPCLFLFSLQIESSSKKPKNTKQICSVCDSKPNDEATFGYLIINNSQNKASTSPSKSNYSGYVRSLECSEWAPTEMEKKPVKEKRSRKLQITEIPENQVPQMVEAFRPLIEECIRVNEVLPYLHFLGISVFVIVNLE